MDNGPLAAHALVDLGAVPAHGAFAAVADEAVAQHGGVAVELDARVENFVVLDLDLPADGGVECLQRGQAVDAGGLEGIEVSNVGGGDGEKTAGVAFAPAVEGLALQRQNHFGDGLAHMSLV